MDLDSYIECAIWSSSCWERMEDDNPIEFDAVEDCEGISDAARDKMESELADFHEKADKIIESKDWEEISWKKATLKTTILFEYHFSLYFQL